MVNILIDVIITNVQNGRTYIEHFKNKFFSYAYLEDSLDTKMGHPSYLSFTLRAGLV